MLRQVLADSSQYKTEKLIFAAYLMVALKAELIGVLPLDNSKNVVFILSKSPSTEEVTSFFNGTAKVSALRYAEAMNILKSVAYEARRQYA